MNGALKSKKHLFTLLTCKFNSKSPILYRNFSASTSLTNLHVYILKYSKLSKQGIHKKEHKSVKHRFFNTLWFKLNLTHENIHEYTTIRWLMHSIIIHWLCSSFGKFCLYLWHFLVQHHPFIISVVCSLLFFSISII